MPAYDPAPSRRAAMRRPESTRRPACMRHRRRSALRPAGSAGRRGRQCAAAQYALWPRRSDFARDGRLRAGAAARLHFAARICHAAARLRAGRAAQGYAHRPRDRCARAYEIQSAKPPVLVAPPRGAPLSGAIGAGTRHELRAAGSRASAAAAVARPQIAPRREATGTVRGRPAHDGSRHFPPDYRPETGPRKELPPQFRRTMVDYRTKEPAGTIIIDTREHLPLSRDGQRQGAALRRRRRARRLHLDTASRRSPAWRSGRTGIRRKR